ncbi:MAG: RnfABCDGE type electron transport complex subunit G [Pseudomonadota bacterium]
MTSDRFPLKSALALMAMGLAAAVLLAGLNELTREAIAEAREQRALATLNQVLDPGLYDNQLNEDTITLTIDGQDRAALLYRARLDGSPVAAIIDMTTSRGYSGDIRLLLAITPEGVILSVRVVDHRETPGLGDKIEHRRSEWIEQFDGRSLSNPERSRWASDQRGGDFDTLTSATITSTAVIDAVARALASVEHAGDAVWTAEAGSTLPR